MGVPFRTGMGLVGGTDVVDMKQEEGKVCAILCCDGVQFIWGCIHTLGHVSTMTKET